MSFKKNDLYPILTLLLKPVFLLLNRARLPRLRGSLALKGLSNPVEILRDRWGVPHIYAGSAADAVFAQGFVQAQERLWQMDIHRRYIQGRLAEILGSPALPSDRAMRTLGLRRAAERDAAQLPGSLKRLATAYCAGVNAWIDLAVHHGRLPLEFSLLSYRPEPWQPADITGNAKLMDWVLQANWDSEFMRGQIVRRLGPEKARQLEVDTSETWAAILDAAQGRLDPTRRFAGPHAGEGVGSNNWVVHGSRTATGLPLLANDMHLALTAPAIWYENHLAGGELEISGVSLPGALLVVAGHNRHVAWGYTDGFTDVQDLYEERLRQNASGTWEYEFKGEWQPAEVRHETIRLRGGQDVVEEVISTCHGPIVNILFREAFPDSPPLALRWTALEPETTFQALYEMNIAHDCAEFHRALALFTGPGQNTVYADTHGDVGYTLSGKIPIRLKGDGSLPVPGWTGEYEWAGFAPFEDQPHLENPPPGFIATANNPQSRETGPVSISRDYSQTDRAERITELLDAREKIDLAYIRRMHYDQVSPSALRLAAALGVLRFSEPELQDVAAQMSLWDGHLAPGSTQAAVYEATIRQAIHLLLEAHLGDLGMRVQGQGPASGLWGEHSWEWFIHLLDTPDSPWFDLGNGERRDEVLALALRQAVATLHSRPVSSVTNKLPTWGDLHRLTFRHILGDQMPFGRLFNLGSYPIGGDGNTLWASFTHSHDLESGPMVGPPFRFIADLADLDHCWAQLAPGQSGHPASRHYRDGIRPWFAGEYHPMLFRRDEVEQNAEARMRLVPLG